MYSAYIPYSQKKNNFIEYVAFKKEKKSGLLRMQYLGLPAAEQIKEIAFLCLIRGRLFIFGSQLQN